MTALERIAGMKGKILITSPDSIAIKSAEEWVDNMTFLLRAFNVMLAIAKDSHADQCYYLGPGPCTDIDERFNEKMLDKES